MKDLFEDEGMSSLYRSDMEKKQRSLDYKEQGQEANDASSILCVLIWFIECSL